MSEENISNQTYEDNIQALISSSIELLETNSKHDQPNTEVTIVLDNTKDKNLKLTVNVPDIEIPKKIAEGTGINRSDENYSQTERIIFQILELANYFGLKERVILDSTNKNGQPYRYLIEGNQVEIKEPPKNSLEKSSRRTVFRIFLNEGIKESQLKHWVERHIRWSNIAINYMEVNSGETVDRKILDPVNAGNRVELELYPDEYVDPVYLRGPVIKNKSRYIVFHNESKHQRGVMALRVSKSDFSEDRFFGKALLDTEEGHQIVNCGVEPIRGLLTEDPN